MNTSRLTCLQSSVQYSAPPKITHCEVLIQTSCCCCKLIRYCSQTSRWIEYLQPPRASGTLSSLSERLGGQSAPAADSLWKQSHSRDGFYYCLVTGIHWPPGSWGKFVLLQLIYTVQLILTFSEPVLIGGGGVELGNSVLRDAHQRLHQVRQLPFTQAASALSVKQLKNKQWTIKKTAGGTKRLLMEVKTVFVQADRA